PIAAMQAQRGEAVGRGDALVVEIVNRVDRPRAAELIAPAQSRMKINGKQRRMPIVRVDDVRRDAEHLASADDGAAEEGEALDAVVVPVETRRVNVRT